MPKASETTLVRRSAEGDPASFVELVHRHEQPLSALIRRLVGNPHDAEDVLQDTLLQAWAGIRNLREPGNVRAWLLQVARNRCRDFLRSTQRRDCPTEEGQLEEFVNAFGRAAGRPDDRAAEVVEALQEVRPAERAVVKLFYLEGLTISEIAARMRCPEGSVKRRLFNGREHVRHLLGLTEREET